MTLAHGGTAGLVIELALAFGLFAVLIVVTVLRERRGKREREREEGGTGDAS